MEGKVPNQTPKTDANKWAVFVVSQLGHIVHVPAPTRAECRTLIRNMKAAGSRVLKPPSYFIGRLFQGN